MREFRLESTEFKKKKKKVGFGRTRGGKSYVAKQILHNYKQ